jgi:cation transport ATPase
MEPTTEHAPLDALPLLSRALSFEDSLRRRTEGVTWAIWGIVLALVFFMYAAMGGALGERGPPWWAVALWLPWVIAGSALTWALWRTSALGLAGKERRPAGLAVALAWIAALFVGLGVVFEGPQLPNPDHSPLLAVGLAWLLMGGTNLLRATPTGRRAALLIGALTMGAGLAMAFLLRVPAGDDVARFAQDVLRGAAAASFPIAVGLWQALRG